MRDELYSQVVSPPQRYALVTTAGVLLLERRRPVDVLQQVLEDRDAQRLAQFFAVYGAAEAGAMCLILAAGGGGGGGSPPPQRVVEAATAALENPSLVGEPHMPEDDPAAGGGGLGLGAPASAADARGRSMLRSPAAALPPRLLTPFADAAR